MNGDTTSLLALQMRKLLSQHGADSAQLADAVQALLEGQRAAIADRCVAEGDLLCLPTLRAVE